VRSGVTGDPNGKAGSIQLRSVCAGNYFGKIDTSKRGRAYYECSSNHNVFGSERCPLTSRLTQAARLDEQVWTEVLRVLGDRDHLRALAGDFIAEQELDRGRIEHPGA
jgi:hypothetical protein